MNAMLMMVNATQRTKVLRVLRVLSVWAAALCLFWSGAATAGNVYDVKITAILGSGGADVATGFFFYTDKPPIGAAACATQTSGMGYRWVINPNTASGKAGIAALLTAYSLGKSIDINGLGSCLVWGDTETVAWFYVRP